MHTNRQLKSWSGEFGDRYIDRNMATKDAISLRLKMWSKILSLIEQPSEPKSVLEVGCGVGTNLRALKMLLPEAKLYGIEPNQKAIDILELDRILPHGRIEKAAAHDIPHASNSFDLVFTSGVLIHIPPDDLLRSCREIERVSRRYIVSIEYFADQPIETIYRDETSLLFKRDFGLFWLENFPSLTIRDYGFFWRPHTGLDNLTWWIFEKSLQPL